MNKRLFAVTTALLMALSLAACGESDDDDDDEPVAPKKTLAAAESEEESAAATTTTTAATTTTTTTTTAAQPASTLKDYSATGYEFTLDTDLWSQQTTDNNDFKFSGVGLSTTCNLYIWSQLISDSFSYDRSEEIFESYKETYAELDSELTFTETGNYSTNNGNDYDCIHFVAESTDDSSEWYDDHFLLFGDTYVVTFQFIGTGKYSTSYKLDYFFDIMDTVTIS